MIVKVSESPIEIWLRRLLVQKQVDFPIQRMVTVQHPVLLDDLVAGIGFQSIGVQADIENVGRLDIRHHEIDELPEKSHLLDAPEASDNDDVPKVLQGCFQPLQVTRAWKRLRQCAYALPPVDVFMEDRFHVKMPSKLRIVVLNDSIV